MTKELLDERLTQIMSRQEYQELKTRAERAYARIEADAPAGVLADVADLVVILRQIEARLLDARQPKNTDWAQGSMATLA